MLANRIIQSLKSFRDKLLDTTFRGIDDRYDSQEYNQKWLETHVHTMPTDDKYDYCYVWCLCFAYANLIATKSWEEIATALTRVSPKYFDHIGGSVHNTAGLTRQLGQMLNVPYYIDRLDIFNGGHNDRLIKKVNDFRLSEKLGIDYFLMSAYEPQHYMFLSHSGLEVNPFPGYHGEFIGFRVYKAFRMEL